jgi:uncharacterized protein
MRIWIDIENPPQVQYLLPFRAAFEARGDAVVVTARDYGMTYDLLRAAGVGFLPVGGSFGRSKTAKVGGLLGRARALAAAVGGAGKPDLVVCASRPAALAARRLRIPSFILGDYEYVHQAMYRATDSHLVFPDAIDPAVLRRRGIRAARLVPYRGLKEDLTFAGVDIDGVEPDPRVADAVAPGLVRVLFRPPAEESHYFRSESKDLALELLGHLARSERAVVVLSPRYPWQAEYVERFEWVNQPLVLTEAIPFLPLLESVDAVVSSGGTMLREAAYLGVPAYSIFRSEIGAVDRHLESIGRLTFVESSADFGKLELVRGARRPVLRSNPALVDELVAFMDGVVARRGSGRWLSAATRRPPRRASSPS